MNNPVGWFEIYVQNMDRAKAFYEGVFNVKLERLDTDIDMWSFPMAIERMGCSGSIVKMEGVSSGGNSIIVYFSCEDCAVEAARASEFGGGIAREKMSIGPYGYIALVHDSEGNMIGLHSMK